MDHLTRRATALAALGERDVGALLVTKGTHIRYLTGFSGSAGVLLLAPDPLLVVDFRYREQAGLEAPDLRVDGDVTPPRLWTRVLELLAGEAPDRLGVDTRNLTAEHYLALEGAPTGLVDCAGLLEAQRAVKDEEELQALAEAAAIADAVIDRLPEWLRPGRTENEIAGEIERAQRNLGSERSAAPVLVSSGERSVLPHGAASARVLERGDPIVIDLSPVVRGYRADITRTFMLGKATPEYQRLHDAGMRAHEASIAAVRAGCAAATSTPWRARCSRVTSSTATSGTRWVTGSGSTSTSCRCSRPTTARSWPPVWSSPSSPVCTFPASAAHESRTRCS